IKKSYWYVILSWDGPQRITADKKIAEMVNSPVTIRLESIRGEYRYFTHKDNPEKFQYDEKEIQSINGFDISSFVSLTKEEKYEAVLNIKNIIRNRNITEYIDLLDVLVE